MKKKNNHKPKPKLLKHLREAQKQVRNSDSDSSQLSQAASEFRAAGEIAGADDNDLMVRATDLLAKVSELATSLQYDESFDQALVDDLVGFVASNADVVEEAAKGADRESDIESFIEFAHENWDEYLSLFEDSMESENEFDFGDAADEFDESWTGDETLENIETSVEDLAEEGSLDNSQIQMMLSALSGNGGTPESSSEVEEEADTLSDELESKLADADSEDEPEESGSGSKEENENLSEADRDAEARAELASDRDLLQAYLDDALRCLGSMEQAALRIEESPGDHDIARQFCRELHTLKGASGTVGLHGLAKELHELESSLETNFAKENDTIDADPLFNAVDRVREVIESLQDGDSPSDTGSLDGSNASSQGDSDATKTNQKKSRPAASRPSDFSSFVASKDDASVRIRASKLDRLMDMLAELVVLRNRRESHVTEFNELNEELARCAARVSFADERSALDAFESGEDVPRTIGSNLSSSNLSEVAKDINAVSIGLREIQKPVSQDNLSISRFIRDFRQELMQLRRVPVSGLFSRLQRAARDAARIEEKQIRVSLEGEHAGLEQEFQERLFDSLLHVVRNSVSHGIEAPKTRVKSGKPEQGSITLAASSSAQLLTIEVRDDGAGINYEAVRRRGIERGLISAQQSQTEEQLARLIFHPGFSTREQASEISGRGVGMDVVATTIEEMRGRIEIDSTPGQGTTIRLLVPLRTGIEHVMVFRSGTQLFALPMQAVTSAKSAKVIKNQDVDLVSLNAALSIPTDTCDSNGDALMLRGTSLGGQATRQLALSIDEFIGPEEVVVRGLPNLLHNHPLINGITLSGSGKKVLLLDTDRLVEYCLNQSSDLSLEDNQDSSDSSDDQKRVLVVDDSLTARKVLGKILRHLGFSVTEAGDGMEAIEKLHHDTFDLVMTDLDMPRMGGLELLADIENGTYCDAPRVVVSSRNEEKFRDQAIESGATDFLNKPVNKTSVNDLLTQLELLSTN